MAALLRFTRCSSLRAGNALKLKLRAGGTLAGARRGVSSSAGPRSSSSGVSSRVVGSALVAGVLLGGYVRTVFITFLALSASSHTPPSYRLGTPTAIRDTDHLRTEQLSCANPTRTSTSTSNANGKKAANGSESQSQYISYEEVQRHNTRESCWVVIDGQVYDATSVLLWHPAGAEVILQLAGKDAT